MGTFPNDRFNRDLVGEPRGGSTSHERTNERETLMTNKNNVLLGFTPSRATGRLEFPKSKFTRHTHLGLFISLEVALAFLMTVTRSP